MSRIKGPDQARDPNHELERLVLQYQQPLLRTCFLYLRDRALAEDAVQEVFLALWNQSERLQELEVEEGQRYFTQALKNHCISQLRRREVRRVADEAVETIHQLAKEFLH